MQVLKKGLYLLVYLVYCTPSGNCQSSACSRFINYYGSGGTLYIDPPSDSTVLDLSAEFTVAVHIKAKDFGELTLVENSDALLRRLQRNDASPIQYSVRFPISSPKPYLTTLTLNNKILCRDTAQDPPLYTKLNLHYKWFSDVPVILKNTGFQESNPSQQYQQQQNYYNRPSYYEPPVTFTTTRAPFTCPPPPPPQKCYCPAPVQTTCPPPPPCYCPEPKRATCPPPEPPQRCYCPATTKSTCPPPPPPPRCSCPAPPPPPPATPCKNNDDSDDTESWKYQLCGESPVQPTNLVYDGTTTANGRYPWVTAIYHVGKQGINFQCGGTLVTAKHTVTAAHCVINEATNQVITDKVVVFLDRYEVLRFNDNAIAPQIAHITIHPDYRYGKITDLAIITFKVKVKFGPYIKPICLWNIEKEETEFFPSGQIVGWGKNDYGEISNKQKEAEMTILHNKECRKIGGFEDILTNSSFCAKKAEGDRGGSPCNGDSGGGLYVRSKQGGRWYLRGVISKALVDNNKRCFPQKPAAFADVSSQDVVRWMEWTMHREGADPLPDS